MANATKCLVEHGARIDRARIDAIAKSYISDEPSLTQDQALIKAAEYIQADYKRLEQGVIAEIQKQWQEQKHFYGGQDNGLQKETETTKTLTETPHVHTLQPENIPSGTANENSGHGEDRGRNSEPLVSGLAENNAGTDSNGGISGRTDQSVRAGDGSIGEGKTNDTLDTSGDQPSIRSGAESTDGHTITDSDELGSGGLGKKYKDNIAAINTLKLIESENRIATPEERKVLARYVGWGALASVFDPKNKNYQAVKDLLTPEEYRSALSSTRNAFYTSKPIVDFMYKALEHLGFKGGRILEPSLGSGNFFGLMPAKLKNNSKLHGVEMDNLTSRLAKALYPNAVISTSTKFEDYQVPSGYFDVSIGNPPFGSETIADRERSPYSGFNIHNYFIAKMIDKVRDGGIVPVIVSHSFMDTINPKAREWIAQRANLIGAVRLPDTAFKENAGTEVVTDILFFQKTATPDQAPDWVKSSDLMIGDNRFSVNDYFQNNKSNVLGNETSSGSMYRGDSYNVESNGDLNKQLAGFIKTLPESIYQDGVTSELVLNDVDNTIPDGVKEGSFFVAKDGTIKQRTSDQAGEKTSKRYVPKNEGEKSRLLGQIQLRELLRSQLRLERDPLATEKQINHNRENLNKAYQEFFNKNGFINSTVNRQAFRDDTESALVQALEFDYDPGISKAVALKNNLEAKAPTAIKADILNRRVLFPPQANMTVTSARDALLSSLDNKGFIDMNHMREVYDKSEDDIIKELGDVVYDDPNTGLVMADEYLSGDVKTKLVEAESAAQGDLKYTRNIDALKKVIPKDKMPSEIFTPLSAIWVPSSVYQDFFRHISDGSRTTIAYNPATGTWLSSFHEGGTQARLRNEYGTSRLSAFELFTSLLNGKAVTVRDPIGDGKYVVNEKATQEARAKVDKIKTTWENWLWKDEARAKQLSTLFNDRYNRTVTRKYDGSHLTLPGITPLIPLRKNQINGVWRAIQDRNILLDHQVGSGKTFAIIASIMEMRRLGIARKPIITVPNHIVNQWKSDFSRLYPGSNVLAAEPKDFEKDGRERFFSKIATGDFDAIVIGHSSLTKIGLDPEIELRMSQSQVDEIADAIQELKSNRGDRNIIKDMERIKVNLETKLKKLVAKAGTRSKVMSFNELGIDALVVDELHIFKSLMFTSQKDRVSGLGNPAGSARAMDLFFKIQWMQETLGEKAPLLTATGTPVSNSLSEMYNMQRLMRYFQLKRDGTHLFDSWSSLYGENEFVYEVAPSGTGYRISQRFSKYKNLPSLMANYLSFADVVTLDDLKSFSTQEGKVFPVPEMEGGKPDNVVADRSELQRDFFGVPQIVKDEQGNIQYEFQNVDDYEVKESESAPGKFQVIDKTSQRAVAIFDSKEDAELDIATKALTPKVSIDPNSIVGQFNNIAAITRATNGKVNALSLTGLANLAGLDYRLIDPTAPDFEGSKINKAVDNVMRVYHQWKKDKGTQLIFCDLSTPISERDRASKVYKRVYIVGQDGKLTHKSGTLNVISGYEGVPFFFVKNGKTTDVYHAPSGQLIKSGLSVGDAMGFIDATAKNEKTRNALYDHEPLTQEQIDDYRDANELETLPDGSNEITIADLEAASSSSKFSVYDDIRKKLLKRGIPEQEIAFIHDFNTPKEKEDLFKKVRSGAIRILMGSTQKMGAGTNVQERLVGLHHIDAPWRPSDLEQREGRIIRQGNSLYERDPKGFKVYIGRYATSQTYDTRRWQLLEHKALGIEQLRKYSGENEIDEMEGEASNAADMKAASSGNPLILEETKLSNEIKRLTLLRRSYDDSLYSIARQKETYNRDTGHYKRRADQFIKDQQEIDKHPIPKDKKKIGDLVVSGKMITDKKEAIEAISRIISARKPTATILFRGIHFSLDFNERNIVFSTDGADLATWAMKEQISDSGLLTRIENYVDSIPGRIEYYQEQAAKAAQELLKLEEMKDEGFPQQQLLQDTVVQHREIQRQLMSSTSLDAVPPEDRKEFLSEIEQRKQQLHNLGINPDKAIKYSKRSTLGLVTELAKHDEVFRNTVSKSKSLVKIMSEIAPEFKEEYHDQRGAVKATVFKAPSGREFYVFELFDIWADLSGLKEGDNGNAVYSAIGNYAFNNGKVFIVDPNGISDAAIIRRTNAMLSLALRYGSTDFLGSSKEQESGDLYKGVTPLKWEGNYFDKVNSLIHTVTSTIINNIPDLEYYRYDFDTDQFTDADGKQLADDWAKNLAGTDSAREVHAGEGTLRKVVILKSIASATSSQRPGILERLNSGRGLERGLKGIFSKADNTGSSTTAQVNKEIPSKLKSIVRVIQGYADSSVQGFFDGHLITLVADNISPDTIKSVIAHELFHWVAKTDEKVKAVLERFKSSMQARFELAKAGNATALENKAYQSVVSAETSEADSLEEFNAYLVEHYVQTTGTLKQLFDNLASSVRAFLVRHGFDMGFIKTLTPADLVALTRYSDLTASESPLSEPLYSKRTDYTPEAERVKNEMKADRTAIQLTTGQKLNQATNLWATKANQRVFDRYRSFRDILKDPTAWMMSRLSGNTGGTVEATIKSGQPFLDSSGAVDIDTSKKSLKDAAEPLQGEIDDALLYMAALRAEKENKKSDIAKLRADYLKREIRDIGKEIKDMIYNDKTGSETITKEGAKRVYDLQELLKALNIERKQAIKRSLIRERYVTPDKIKALKTLSRGNMPDGKVRADVYEQFRKDYEEINQSIVQIAVDTGTINKDEADRWSIEGFYIPFYRFMGEESSSGPVTLDSLANNTAYKQYKGSAIPLNDLLVNIVGNWHHLVDSALKNQAANRAVSVAESMGIMKKSKGDSNGDLFIRDNGKKVHYELENPKSDEGKLVLESLLSMNYSGLKNVFMVGATNASQLLRYGVVINPAFKARNLIRDTIQALATTNVGYNPIKNVYEGWQYTKPGGLTQARMISSAGAFGDSGYVFMSETEETAQGIKRQLGMEESTYLGTAKKLLDVYQDFGARLENVNRAVAFEKTLKETRNLLKSAHEANDLLAFQMHGSSTAIYEITRTVPFLNAGLQGIDKIFRSASDEKSAKRFWAVTSTYVVASVILALAMSGDDDYDKTEDWEKETYHFFKLPGSDTLYKIPRPFEMGALASIAETIARQLVSESPDPKQASIRIAHVLSEQLRLNPIPQISRPVLELWANKSMFTGRAIESEGLLHKSKPDRAYASTSLVAKGISQGLNAFGQDWPTSLSPVEVEHLVTSYTGWLGAFALSGTDAILRPLLGQIAPSRASNVPFFGKAAEDIKRAFVEDDAPRNTKFTSQFYENLKTLEGLASDMRHAREVGDSERIKEIGNKSKNVTYYRRTSKAMTLLNKQIESIWRSDLSAEEKKARIDRLNIKRNAIAEKTVKAVKVEN